MYGTAVVLGLAGGLALEWAGASFPLVFAGCFGAGMLNGWFWVSLFGKTS